MKRTHLAIVVTLGAIVVALGTTSGGALAAPAQKNAPKQKKAKTKGLELPTHFRELLKAEMNKIDGAMKALLTDLVVGRPDKAAELANNIHQSFILKQKLSPEELKKLVGHLPRPFIKLDRAFHGQAKTLAGLARKRRFPAAARLYGKMVQGCVTCHQRYAPEVAKTAAKTSP